MSLDLASIGVSKRTRLALALLLTTFLLSSYFFYSRLHGKLAFKSGYAPHTFNDPETSGDPKALLAEATHLYWLSNGPKAGPLFARAEKLFAAEGDSRNELYAKVGRLRSQAETMSFVDLSRILNDQLQNPIVQNDPRLRLWCLIAKGYTDIEIDYRVSKRDWLEAQDIAKSLGESQWVTRASGELGLIAFLEGNPGRAARLLGGALLSTMTNGDTAGQVRFLELLGRGFEEVNRHAEALRFFERAIKLAEADPDCGPPFMGYEGKAQAMISLGRTEEARSVLESALAKAQSQEKRGHEAELLVRLGRLAALTGNRQQALTYLEDAGQFATKVQFYRIEADAMYELAQLYRDAGDLSTADARATQGVTASQQVGDRYYVPRNLSILADLKARRGRYAEGTALYDQAEDVIEGMLTSVDEPYWNSSVVAAQSQTYVQHFELVARGGDVREAFRVLERVRGRTLLWALEDRKAFSSSESEQTASLETDVAGLQTRLMQSSSAIEREQLLDKLVEYERRLGLAWTKGDEANTRLPAQLAPLNIVQADLAQDEMLLEYVLDDPNSYCVSISRHGAFVRVLPTGRKEIEKLAQRYIDEIRSKASGVETSKQLYERLIKPIPEIFKADRILIAPDGILHLLPFEALQDNRDQYLLKSHTISYVPSGTILDTLRRDQKREPAPKPLLAVGDVAYENQGGAGKRLPTPASVRGRIERGIADLSGIALNDLPQTREEVEEIGKIVGPNAVILVAKDATETAFKKEPLDQFRVLHLAVHGFADTQYPERSALVLGVDAKSGDDGLLQVREIIRLRLNAELTTLSACDTGVGKLQGQEGISNLVEAFLVAGSKSVVASLWSADDTSASALMGRFYQRLAEGESASSALRNAKLDLLTKYGDQLSPFYWAAFITVGESSTPIGIKQQ
ncbi:MAG TPA: CHAT domain-containing protein [Candidatus Sulfotelmatobacter sp.]|nr:CHAT domain-containing protein [Candidatus Sulfotelmatobacter sp.]